LDAESTGGESAECIRDDPERNKHPDEENKNAEKEKVARFSLFSGVSDVWIRT